jgi:uncharacterized protein (TIGR02611 family)
VEGLREGQDEEASARSEHSALDRARAWRERIRSGRRTRRIWQLSVALVGGAITIGGLVLVPLPGPGWLIVFVGLAVLATEFVWAQRLLDFGRDKLRIWTAWLGRQSIIVRAAVAAATCAIVLGVVYVVLRVGGVPSMVPDRWVAWVPGLVA